MRWFNGNFDDGYVVGWNEGRDIGYQEGYNDCLYQYENTLKKYNTELLTLNARIDYLTKVLENEKS